jgi:hypothetical protein
MLPSSMLSSHSIQSSSPSPGLSFIRNSLSRRCRCGASAPRFFARYVFPSKLFRIHTTAKHTHKPFGIRTFKTQDLKSFRIRIYEKRGRGGGVPARNRCPNLSPRSHRPTKVPTLSERPCLFASCVSSLPTTHYPLLTTHCLSETMSLRNRQISQRASAPGRSL